ncbi:uncharacterized protein L201_005008 [Kwoniella dendrophila CBS 6074]|uniref:Uncharacterized protein n=1 Tax=Kwoniella dendrophila CBS 6074 TaxID=1295534 RepID=A0AAX4JZV6_9TREE
MSNTQISRNTLADAVRSTLNIDGVDTTPYHHDRVFWLSEAKLYIGDNYTPLGALVSTAEVPCHHTGVTCTAPRALLEYTLPYVGSKRLSQEWYGRTLNAGQYRLDCSRIGPRHNDEQFITDTLRMITENALEHVHPAGSPQQYCHPRGNKHKVALVNPSEGKDLYSLASSALPFELAKTLVRSTHSQLGDRKIIAYSTTAVDTADFNGRRPRSMIKFNWNTERCGK